MSTAADIRTWAKANGVPVGTRGRLDHGVKVAYLKAHPALARQIAKDKGFQVGVRGRMAAELFESLV
jgi:hypothetical protein